MATLARQVLRTLLEMHRQKQIRLEVRVLQGQGPELDDRLLNTGDLPSIRWYSGSRARFAMGLLGANANVQLFDHAGLARLPGLLPRVLRTPYILLIHGVEIWNSGRSDYHRSARNAEFLIANSEYTAKKSRACYADLPDIHVCWPGLDRSASSAPVEDSNPFNIGPYAMLIVGRLSAEQRHKGHDHLIEAMPVILQTVPGAQLVIAGAGGDQSRLEAKASGLNVAQSVVFTGWVTEQQLQGLYSKCAIFVMPSEGDGFGMVFLEAMMHRLPCAGLANGAAAEILEDEKSGVLIDRENIPKMADQLSSLLLDEARRKRIGDTGHDRHQAMFREQHYSARLSNILLKHLQSDA
jgi:phosphatidylinositol alpha-1,6-mannosyltransferase